MRIGKNDEDVRTLQCFKAWATDDERETLIEFEPVCLGEDDFLHINSAYKSGDGMGGFFVQSLSRKEAVVLRNFLIEVLTVGDKGIH